MGKMKLNGGSSDKGSVTFFSSRSEIGVKASIKPSGAIETEVVSTAENRKNMVTLLKVLIGCGLFREVVVIFDLPKFLYHVPTAVFVAVLLVALIYVRANEIVKFHGAEHKVAHWYEKTIIREKRKKDVFKYSRIHSQCGSNLIATICEMYLISSIIFSMTGRQIPEILTMGLPLFVYGIFPFNVLGLLVQLVSTAEPEDKEVAVATAALRGLLEVEAKKEEEQKVS